MVDKEKLLFTRCNYKQILCSYMLYNNINLNPFFLKKILAQLQYSKVEMRNSTALEGEGQQWIAAPA